MPQQNPSRPQHARKLGDGAGIVTRVVEEPKRRKEIHNSIEAIAPFCGKLAHVGAQIVQRRTRTSALRQSEQLVRIIDAVHLEARLGQQMRVAALTTGRIQNARANRQTQQLDDAARFRAIALR